MWGKSKRMCVLMKKRGVKTDKVLKDVSMGMSEVCKDLLEYHKERKKEIKETLRKQKSKEIILWRKTTKKIKKELEALNKSEKKLKKYPKIFKNLSKLLKEVKNDRK